MYTTKSKSYTYLGAKGLLDDGVQATLFQATCVADAGRGQDGDSRHAEHEQDEHQHLPNACPNIGIGNQRKVSGHGWALEGVL